jgi:hypothetical protein
MHALNARDRRRHGTIPALREGRGATESVSLAYGSISLDLPNHVANSRVGQAEGLDLADARRFKHVFELLDVGEGALLHPRGRDPTRGGQIASV